MYFRHTKLAYARFTKFILSQNSSVASIQLNETSFVNRLSKLVSKIKYAQKKVFPHYTVCTMAV